MLACDFLIPDETTFCIDTQVYMIRSVNQTTGLVSYCNISAALTPISNRGILYAPRDILYAPLEQIQKLVKAELNHNQQLETAKALISNYCWNEFNHDATFDNLADVDVAFTTIEDDEIPIEVSIDLINYRVTRFLGYEDNYVTAIEQYESLSELIENELRCLDFDSLTQIEDTKIEQFRVKEHAKN